MEASVVEVIKRGLRQMDQEGVRKALEYARENEFTLTGQIVDGVKL